MQEFEFIVEFSYNPKQETFVVRFLSGESYALGLEQLPKKLLTKKPKWKDTVISSERNSLYIPAGKDEMKVIEAHIIHSKGKLL